MEMIFIGEFCKRKAGWESGWGWGRVRGKRQSKRKPGRKMAYILCCTQRSPAKETRV